jgi:hypothetical protein
LELKLCESNLFYCRACGVKVGGEGWEQTVKDALAQVFADELGHLYQRGSAIEEVEE